MSRWRTLTTRNAEPDRVATTHIQGYWLVLTQIVLGILALFALLVFVVSLSVYSLQLQTVCRANSCAAGQLTLAAVQALHGFGISVDSYVLFRLVNIVASALISFVVAGVLVWRRPHDWMALLVAFMLVMMGMVGTTNTVAGSASVWHVPAQIVSLLTYPTYFLVFMVFPNGRFVPRWIRWLLIPVFAQTVWYTFFPTSFNSNIWLSLFGTLVFVGLASSLPAIQIYRYWRVSTPLERQQTKWVVFGFVVGFALGIGPFVITLIVPQLSQPDSLYSLIFNPDAGGTPLYYVLLPLSFGVAILRYRLWDIDIIINRAVVYGSLTVSILGIYVLVVGLLGALLQAQGNSVISLLATGLVAALFQSLRERLQSLVNRLMYGDRHTPYQAIARLGERLQATLTADAVLPTIVETVAHALKLPYVAMSLKQEEMESTVAFFGVAQEPLVQLPLLYQGESVGELLLAPRTAGEAFSSADRRLLEDLARHAGIAAHTVSLTNNLKRLTKELQRSRTALVTAREEERRRLRRDLHDGMGSTLASLNWQAGALRQALTRNQVAANALIVEQQTIIRSALADIRRLVYDLRPPSLDELGLVGALRGRAAHTTLPTGALVAQEQVAKLDVTVEAAENIPPLPAAIEVAAYRIVQEALTNVVRHAHATTCQVRLSIVEGSLHVEVSDDGVGIAFGQQAGIGLLSMHERAEEVGGRCSIQPGSRGGTQVCASLPFPTD